MQEASAANTDKTRGIFCQASATEFLTYVIRRRTCVLPLKLGQPWKHKDKSQINSWFAWNTNLCTEKSVIDT